jgi:20S proteasome alpha/beta subunit
MRVMFYRDKRATDEIQICKVTKEGGVQIEAPYRISSEWNHRFYSEKTNEFFRPMRVFY